MQIALEDPSDQKGGEALTVEILEEPAKWVDERRPYDLGSADAVEHEAATLADLQNLGEKLREIVHLDAFFPQGLDESVVLVSCPGGPEHTVEEQLTDVLGREAGKLETRAVNDDLSELADFGPDPEVRRIRSGHLGVLLSLLTRIDILAASRTDCRGKVR
jgi:hypothetical protein